MTVLHSSISHTGMIIPSTLLCPLQNATPKNSTADKFLPVLCAMHKAHESSSEDLRHSKESICPAPVHGTRRL